MDRQISIVKYVMTGIKDIGSPLTKVPNGAHHSGICQINHINPIMIALFKFEFFF